MKDKTPKEMIPRDLPIKSAFEQKEVYQHPQPAGRGKALDKGEKSGRTENNDKEQERTSKEEGLNQERSAGNAGAFEGFEDQEDKE